MRKEWNSSKASLKMATLEKNGREKAATKKNR